MLCLFACLSDVRAKTSGRHCLDAQASLAVMTIYPRRRRSARVNKNLRHESRRRGSTARTTSPPIGVGFLGKLRPFPHQALQLQASRLLRRIDNDYNHESSSPDSARRRIRSTSSAPQQNERGLPSDIRPHSPPQHSPAGGSNPTTLGASTGPTTGILEWGRIRRGNWGETPASGSKGDCKGGIRVEGRGILE